MSWTITPRFTPADEYFQNVSLLLHGNQSGGQFIDSSPTAKSITKVGDVASGSPGGGTPIYPSSNSAFGSAIAFDGTGDYVASPNNAALNLVSSDFTIEAWFYAVSFGGNPMLLNKDWLPGSTFAQYGIYFSADNKLAAIIGNNAASYEQIITSSIAAPLNAWVHFAFVLMGTQMYLFQGGLLVGSGTRTGSLGAGSAALCIGSSGVGFNRFFNGYIDDLRITKGVARYTANFSPPAAPFPDI